ncbi:hypothetical protein Q5A_022945 [Serratia inhibens PRI-2C]|nr:hypothetical protein Q5A_022945 [Serratia inhibens PRI-2C]
MLFYALKMDWVRCVISILPGAIVALMCFGLVKSNSLSQSPVIISSLL